MAFQEFSLSDSEIESTHQIERDYSHTANPHPATLPELDEPYPCQNC